MIGFRKSLSAFVILAIILIINIPVSADGSASFSLSPSSASVRAGDTITITGKLNASTVVGTFDLDVRYNPEQLQYVKAEALSPVQPGEIDFSAGSGSIQVLFLDNDGGTSGIKTGSLFRFTFKVSAGQPGDSISLNFNIRTAGDANASGMGTSGSGTAMQMAAPLSTNNNLASLSINTGSLIPAFSKNVTQYNVTVPFEVSRLKISASAEDSTASVSISSPELPAGGSGTASVTVTAASGAKKVYKIKVSRTQDPNYMPSSNSDLASLAAEGFLLSPGFSPAVTEYVVYLPFETESLKILAAAADSKATAINITGHENLQAGSANLVEIIIKAEDGSTKTYTIAAVRAKKFSGLADLVEAELPEPTTQPTVSETTTETTAAAPTSYETEISQGTETTQQEAGKSGLSTAAILAVTVLSILVLAAAGFLIWLFAVKRVHI